MARKINLKKLTSVSCKIRKGNLVCRDKFSKKKPQPKFEAQTVYLDPHKALKKGALVTIALDKRTGDALFGGYANSYVDCEGYSDGTVNCELKIKKKR